MSLMVGLDLGQDTVSTQKQGHWKRVVAKLEEQNKLRKTKQNAKLQNIPEAAKLKLEDTPVQQQSQVRIDRLGGANLQNENQENGNSGGFENSIQTTFKRDKMRIGGQVSFGISRINQKAVKKDYSIEEF